MKVNEIIVEVEQIEVGKAKGKWADTDPSTEKDVIERGAVLLGKTKSGHRIYNNKKPWYANNILSGYYAINPVNNKVDLMLEAYEKNNVLRSLRIRAISKKNTLKAHDFYHYLITKLNKVLVADKQSPGGEAVWRQLQKFHRDVTIHGWLDGKPVNIDMNDPEYTHAPEAQGWFDNDPPEIKAARKMELVASKKVK